MRHDAHRLYWWDRSQPGPTGNGIVHFVASDQTLPPMVEYPGHSTYCGAVKFPGENLSLDRLQSGADDDFESYHGLEPFPVGETPASVDRPVCEDCASVYRRIVRGRDERAATEAVERFLWKSPGEDPEDSACLLRKFRTDRGATGVEYTVAEYLCHGVELGAVRRVAAFDGIRLNDPRAVFGDAVCPECASAYEDDIWTPIIEQSQVVVTLLADREEIDGEISRAEERLRERIERSEQNAHTTGFVGYRSEESDFGDLHTTTLACTGFEIVSGARVRLTNSLGRTKTLHQAEILDVSVNPAQQVIY